MRTPRAETVSGMPPPTQSRLQDHYAKADLIDSYALALPPGAPTDPYVLAKAILTNPPPWFAPLLGLRDLMMAPLGVKTSGQVRQARDGRERIAFFPVLSRSATELVLGEDDRHLDFRLSVLVTGETAERRVNVTSVVRCHNTLGHAYLLAIRPFHILVVRGMLQRLAHTLRRPVA
jgi:Protein of unknown function (DUF2867)